MEVHVSLPKNCTSLVTISMSNIPCLSRSWRFDTHAILIRLLIGTSFFFLGYGASSSSSFLSLVLFLFFGQLFVLSSLDGLYLRSFLYFMGTVHYTLSSCYFWPYEQNVSWAKFWWHCFFLKQTSCETSSAGVGHWASTDNKAEKNSCWEFIYTV